MNRFDQIDTASGMGDMDGWLSKKWKSVKKVGSKLNKVRKKLTPKPLRKPLSKIGKGVRTGMGTIANNKVVMGVVGVVGSVFPPVAIAGAAVGAIGTYDKLEKGKQMQTKAKAGFKRDVDKLFYLHPKDREKVYAQAGISADTRNQANRQLFAKYAKLTPAQKVAYQKKVNPKKHAATVKRKWDLAVKKKLAAMPAQKAQALVAKKIASDKAKAFAKLPAKKQIAITKKTIPYAGIPPASVRKRANRLKWEDAVRKKLASMPPAKAQALVAKKLYAKPPELIEAETLAIGGTTIDAITDAALEFGQMPEIQDTIYQMQQDGYSDDQIVSELNNSQVMRDMTNEVAREAITPQMTDYYLQEGYDEEDAYYAAQNDVNKAVDAGAAEKKGVGALLLPVAGAALMVMG